MNKQLLGKEKGHMVTAVTVTVSEICWDDSLNMKKFGIMISLPKFGA